jgi:hypothetical protein
MATKQSRQAARAARWFLNYENALKTREDFIPGRVNWDAAKFLHAQGYSAESAAASVTEPCLPYKERS